MTKSIQRGWNRYRAVPIVYRIGAAFVLGSIVGLAVSEPVTVHEPLGDLFVRLLSMIVVPIIIYVTGDLAVAALVSHWNDGIDFSSGSCSGTAAASPSDD